MTIPGFIVKRSREINKKFEVKRFSKCFVSKAAVGFQHNQQFLLPLIVRVITKCMYYCVASLWEEYHKISVVHDCTMFMNCLIIAMESWLSYLNPHMLLAIEDFTVGGSHFPRNVGSHQNFHFQRWINFLTHSSKMTKKLFSKYIPKNEDYCSTILGWCFVSIWNVSHLHTNVIILHGCGWHPYLGLCSKVQITSKPSCQKVVLININWRLHIICLIDIVKIYC